MKRIFLFMLFLLLLNVIVVADADLEADYTSTQAQEVLIEARLDMQEMIKAEFNVSRINDTINRAEQLFQAQLALEEKGGTPDYSSIIEDRKDIGEIKEDAFKAKDEIGALELLIEQKEEENIDLIQAKLMLDGLKNNFYDERYEIVIQSIEEVYDEISKAEAESATLNVIYRTTTEVLIIFVRENIVLLVSVSLIVVIIVIFGKGSLERHLIRKKIMNLKVKRNVLKSLIKKAQKEYFQKHKISEGNYETKLRKFTELIRDIDREVPLLKAELLKEKDYLPKFDKRKRNP